MARFSVQTHRGCVGRCSFCALSLHQGDRIVSRSEASILEEIRRMTKHPEWKGFVDDLGGPTANMYGLDAAGVAPAHRRLIGLMRAARKVPGVKKVFVRSGIRYDLALESPEYIRELARHHVSGLLKIAPEHVSENVLKLMNKSGGRRRLEEFRKMFAEATGAARGKGGRAETRRPGGRPAPAPQILLHGRPSGDDGKGSPRARRLRPQPRAERGEAGRGRPDLHPDAHDPLDLHVSHGPGPDHGRGVYVPRPYAEKKAQKRLLRGRRIRGKMYVWFWQGDF